MELNSRLGLALLLIAIVAIGFGMSYGSFRKANNPFADRDLLKKGDGLPRIWLYYDTSEVNSRWWMDFGARSSRALNVPFLNLCYETVVAQNGDKFRVEVINGLTGVADLLGGWQAVPPGLRNPLAPVNTAEKAWIRAAILAKYGGLWLELSSVCLKPFGELPKDKVVFFGTDLDETYAGKLGTVMPGFRCIWSPAAGHPLFVEWEQICRDRVDRRRGGQQIRGDEKWDWVELSAKYTGIAVDHSAEVGRKKDGRRIQLEDLLAAGQDGKMSFDVSPSAKYVPVPWTELRDREMFGWFLRMSEKQILESDLSITWLLHRGLVEPPPQPLPQGESITC
jgi:hypothetical protein